MPDMFFDVDTAITECPVNIMPLIDDTDFKSREVAIAYNAAGMDLVWNFCTSAGAFTQTAVTPTTAGVYDWTHQGDGMYTIEIPASGGASINNDTEGYGWFTGFVTGVLPWRGPIIGFRAAALNDALCDGGDNLDVNTVQWLGTACATPTVAGVPEVDTTHVSGTAQTAKDIGAAVPAAAAGASGGLLISGSNSGTTTLGALTVTGAMTVSGGATFTSSTGNGLTCSSSGGNGNGLAVAGNGSGSGLNAFGGATGHGLFAIGGITSGDGIHAHGTAAGDGIHAESHGTNQHGIHATGIGTGSGVYCQAGATGNGMTLVGGATSGDGLDCSVTSGIEIDANITGNITGNLSGSVGSVTGAVGSVTGAVGSVTGNVGGNVVGSVASVTGAAGSVTGAVGSVTGNVGGNVTGSVGSLATQAKADVNAEVLDVLNTDTFAEPGQGAPAATASLAAKIGYLYKFLRNKVTTTSTTISVYDDAGTTVDQKSTISDDATTFNRGEFGSGP